MANQSDYRSRQGRGYIADLVYETPGYGEGPEHEDDISLSSDAYEHEDWSEGTERTDDTESRKTTPRDTNAPFAGVGPKGYRGRSADARLWNDVCQLLTDSSEVDAEDITVEVQDAEVTLTGTVESRRTKRLAEDIACSISGIHDVHNRLRIRTNTPE